MTGGLLGMLAFGPISERLGRRGAFSFFFVGGFASSALLFGVFTEKSVGFYWMALPVFGFLVSGIHSGYAIYFPELFPSRLRGTGGGFCFNMGRIIAAPVLFLTAWMQQSMGFTTNQTRRLVEWVFSTGFDRCPIRTGDAGRGLARIISISYYYELLFQFKTSVWRHAQSLRYLLCSWIVGRRPE